MFGTGQPPVTTTPSTSFNFGTPATSFVFGGNKPQQNSPAQVTFNFTTPSPASKETTPPISFATTPSTQALKVEEKKGKNTEI